ncbi:carboxymethylenebutenolidase [Granulicella aggregans]|uniref:Carboxymethylenebutenolidase n=1 Tax=Granulicella aggregans TaxID=474949 RepID=A0A7W7ZCA0_9BACT|nr:alpha/beta fold hydrolase [Granulicella aggregans]MBB5057188.1 carboxymethylenebutenolidase [Granulicella aggregans]
MHRISFLVVLWFLGALLVSGQLPGETSKRLRSGAGAETAYDEFGDPQSAKCLVLLHGASGPVPFYRDQARFFGDEGFRVLMPHYFDSTRGQSPSPENYRKWASVTADFVAECRKQASTKAVFLIGFSLGSSVALAAGSQNVSVNAIADWYGSLPDEFFYQMKGMPPLLILHGERDSNIPIMNAQQLVKLCEMKHLDCEHHFYADQEHGFQGAALEDARQRTLTFFAEHAK